MTRTGKRASATARRGQPREQDRSWRRGLRRVFANPWVEVAVAVLVVISVVLTLCEFTFEASAPDGHNDRLLFFIRLSAEAITLLFAVELTLRFIAATEKRRYFREYFLDILAVVLPLVFLFPAARALRLLRLIRVLRLFGVVSRLASHFPYVIKRGAVEFFVVVGLLVITVIFGTGAMMFFEAQGAKQVVAAEQPRDDDERFDFENSFWFSVYTLFAGEPTPMAPRTLGGKMAAVFVMFMGLTIFAMLTGTVSAFMIERFRTEGRGVDWDELQNHIIICGWNAKTEIIVQEYHATTMTRTIPIVVISQLDVEAPPISEELQDRVLFLHDDFTRVVALEKAGIHRASTCIILADTSGGRSEQDADARTILAALTVEKLNPSVYTCAELLNRSYGTHLQMGHVNDYVVSGEYSAFMLAQAAMNRGLMGVFTELLTYQHGNEFYRLSLPDRYHGKSFLDLMVELKQSYNAILIAVHTDDDRLLVNPVDHEFAEGDEVVVIAEKEFKL